MRPLVPGYTKGEGAATTSCSGRNGNEYVVEEGKGTSEKSCAKKCNILLRRRPWYANLAAAILLLAPLITWLICIVLFGTVCSLQKTGVAPTLPCSIFYQWTSLNRRDMLDFQIDSGLEQDILYSLRLSSKANQGSKHLQTARVLISGMVINAEESLKALSPDLDTLLENIPNSKLVVCESCSTDNTVKVLEDWRAARGDGRVVLPSNWSSTVTSCEGSVDNDPEHGIWGMREKRLAELRNDCLQAGLKEIGEPSTYEYLITIDMDVYRIDAKGVMDSFGVIEMMKSSNESWAGLCANGKFVNGIFRDTYAHRSNIDTAEHYPVYDNDGNRMWYRNKFMNLVNREKVQLYVRDIMVDWRKRHKVYPVDSCFGGLAIYDMQSIRDCEYHGVAWDEQTGSLRPDCEHLSFNACASGRYKVGKAQGRDDYTIQFQDTECSDCKNIIFNPRMQVWHGKNAWTGLLGPAMYYPIMFLGIWMRILDVPLGLFRHDSLFVLSWVAIYLVAFAAVLVLQGGRIILLKLGRLKFQMY